MKTLTTKELERLRDVEDEALVAEIAQRMKDVASNVLWLSAAIQELSRRHSDIAEHYQDICRSGFWVYLPLVASGAVLPMTVATLCASDKLLPIVAQLPIAEQERIVAPEAMIEVEFPNPRYGKTNEPEFDTRKYLPYLLPDGLIPQVFDMDAKRVRNKLEQRAYIKSHPSKATPTRKAKVPTLRVDVEHMLVYVDQKPVRVSALADAIAQLAADRPEVEAIFKRAFRETKPVKSA